MTSRPQFLILDQSLLDADGHHYDMDRHVARAAKDMGMAPRVAAHRNFDLRLPFDQTPLDAWFSQTWVDAHQSRVAQTARRVIQSAPRQLQTPLLSFAGLARRLISSRADLPAPPPFGSEAITYLCEQNAGSGDHVFVHTLAGAELHSLCEALTRSTITSTVHVVLRRSAAEAIMSKGVPGGLPALLSRISSDTRLSRQMRFYTDTDALTHQHQALCPALPIITLPIPIAPIDAALADAPRQPGPLRLLYLGNARTEKGFQLLPIAVAALQDASGTIPDTVLIAQAHSSTSLTEAVIEDTRRRLRTSNHVILIEEPLSTEDYARQLATADIILLPYDREAYRERSSGILIQALAAGKPVVVPDQSWLSDTTPANTAAHFGADADFGRAAIEAVQRIDILSKTTRAGAQEWRRKHSPLALVETLLRNA